MTARPIQLRRERSRTQQEVTNQVGCTSTVNQIKRYEAAGWQPSLEGLKKGCSSSTQATSEAFGSDSCRPVGARGYPRGHPRQAHAGQGSRSVSGGSLPAPRESAISIRILDIEAIF